MSAPRTDSRRVAPLRIALSKGRIFEETLPLFAAAGIRPAEDPGSSRKLIIPSVAVGEDVVGGDPASGVPGEAARSGGGPAEAPAVEFLIVRASDVPTYVRHGGADLGVVGKDVLMEHGGEGLLEPLDLRIARCRLMVAGHAEAVPGEGGRGPGTIAGAGAGADGGGGHAAASRSGRRLRVATKYAEVARRHFARRHRQVEIIKLYGSMELAPLVGLADLIVDVVDTGSTLRANGLVPLEHIADVSSRLIVNRASMKTRHREIEALVARVAAAVDAATTSGGSSPGSPSASSGAPPVTSPSTA